MAEHPASPWVGSFEPGTTSTHPAGPIVGNSWNNVQLHDDVDPSALPAEKVSVLDTPWGRTHTTYY